MQVIRGRAQTVEVDRAVTGQLLARAAADREPGVRVWTPHRVVAFGRKDVRSDGYDDATAAARSRGYVPVERDVGGRAVAYTGETTLSFALATPVDDMRAGLDRRFEHATDAVQRGLASVGADLRRGEPARAYCPGEHSLQNGGKVVGVAQRVTRGAALLGGIVVVAEHRELADVLAAVYAALSVPFDPETVGSVATAGGPDDPATVARAVESALVDGEDPVVVGVEEYDAGTVEESATGTEESAVGERDAETFEAGKSDAGDREI